MSKPIFCILGKTGAGKSTLLDFFTKGIIKIDVKLKKLVYHTTRNIREGEINGVDYYFEDKDIFSSGKAKFKDIVEMRDYTTKNDGSIFYYTLDSDFDMEDCDGIICAASADQAIKYMKAKENVYFIILDIPVKERMLRVLKRGNPSEKTCLELCRRILEENEEFSAIWDLVNENNSVVLHQASEDPKKGLGICDDIMYNWDEIKSMLELIKSKCQ